MDFPLTTGMPVPEALGMPLFELDMPVRASNGLRDAGWSVAADVAMCNEAQVFSRKNIGRKSVHEIIVVLGTINVSLASIPAVPVLQATAEYIGVPVDLREKIAARMYGQRNPSVLALTLFPRDQLRLTSDEKRTLNRALSAHHPDLRLGMHIHDLFVERRELTPDQLGFLGQDIAVLDLPHPVRDELLAIDWGCCVWEVYLIARLPGYPHRDIIDSRFREHGLSLDMPIAAQEFLRIRPPP